MRFIIIIIFFITGCSSNKVSKNHGFISLDTKLSKIIINKSNKNDLINEIGVPSSISKFNSNKWFYIERKQTNQSLFKLGVKKISKNNILIIEFNKMGIVKSKNLVGIDDMNDTKFVKRITTKEFEQDNTIYNIFSSLREKVNAPSKRKKTIIDQWPPAITAKSNKATIFVILIIGFTAGPAVSLYGSPTVSPVTAAL